MPQNSYITWFAYQIPCIPLPHIAACRGQGRVQSQFVCFLGNPILPLPFILWCISAGWQQTSKSHNSTAL